MAGLGICIPLTSAAPHWSSFPGFLGAWKSEIIRKSYKVVGFILHLYGGVFFGFGLGLIFDVTVRNMQIEQI
jgi:hypothetical protein